MLPTKNRNLQQIDPFFNVIMPLWKKMSKRYNCTANVIVQAAFEISGKGVAAIQLYSIANQCNAMLLCKQHMNTQIQGKGVAAIQLYSVCTSREPFAVEGSCTI